MCGEGDGEEECGDFSSLDNLVGLVVFVRV